jgi:hypothetical protein
MWSPLRVSGLNTDKKDDNYWLGVRDALRMVDSFLRWSERNPDKAKSLQDFISEGLIAAAKRCEECLSKELGLSFKDNGTVGEFTDLVDEVLPPVIEEAVETPSADDYFERTPEMQPSEPRPETVAPTEEMHFKIESVSEPVSDTPTVSEPTSEEPEPLPLFQPDTELAPEEADPTLYQPTREFDADFSLGEPEPLVIESDETEEPPSVPIEIAEEEDIPDELDELEEAFSTHGLDVSLPKVSEEPSEEEQPSEFTWRDYESAISTEELEKSVEDSEGVIPEPPPEPTTEPTKPKVWSPYDEPSVDESTSVEERKVEDEEPPAEVPPEEPPAPPPPESDETEEERRRRARRLFFGA